MEREIWLVRDRRGVGWFEWNRKCELMHQQLWGSVKPLWRLIEDYIVRHTKATLAEDAGSPLGIIATCEEEADEISAFIEPLLRDWPMLTAVRNSIYFASATSRTTRARASRRSRGAWGSCPANHGRGRPSQRSAMLDRRYAHHLACPANAVDAVKKQVSSQGGQSPPRHRGWRRRGAGTAFSRKRASTAFTDVNLRPGTGRSPNDEAVLMPLRVMPVPYIDLDMPDAEGRPGRPARQ